MRRPSRAFILAAVAAEDLPHLRREVSHSSARGTFLHGEGIFLLREVANAPRGAAILLHGVKIVPRGDAILSRGATIGPRGHANASRGLTILARGLAILLHDEKIVPRDLANGPRDATIELHNAAIPGPFVTKTSLQAPQPPIFARPPSLPAPYLELISNPRGDDLGVD